VTSSTAPSLLWEVAPEGPPTRPPKTGKAGKEAGMEYVTCGPQGGVGADDGLLGGAEKAETG